MFVARRGGPRRPLCSYAHQLHHRPPPSTPYLGPFPGSPLSVSSSSSSSSPASSSRHPYSTFSSFSRSQNFTDLKGKGKAIDPDDNMLSGNSRISFFGQPSARSLSARTGTSHLYGVGISLRSGPLLGRGPAISGSNYGSSRSFHASARRDAIPLIPGTIAILKGTSVLTAATVFSRIIISFFPIGTLAAFKMIRVDRWMNSEVVRPNVRPEAQEFWEMWCENEREIRLTRAEAGKFVDSDPDDNGGLVGEDGRIAYNIPMPSPPGWSSRAKKDGSKLAANEMMVTPRSMMEYSRGNRRRVASWIARAYFYMPDLPPASIRFYEDLTPEQRSDVDSLRRYWMGLKAFKHRFEMGRWLIGLVFALPVLLLSAVYLAGLERAPLTGRWRLILLTPEEEDAISTSLAGQNWYRSVINLLTTPEKPAPPFVPQNDWRWAWVQSTLSRLETGALSDCQYLPEDQRPPKIINDSTVPVPPAPYHPLKPRPRVSSWLHSILPGGEPNSGREHLEIGPPYNLILMEKDERNAFSYGFGGKRAGGIVVFTGLLDSILKDKPTGPASSETPIAPAASRGFFGSLFSSSPSPSSSRRPQNQPTEEQTLHLACVLAHEMGHLLLSHHLETLSQQQVLWPSLLGLTMDLVRAFIWPFTVFLGPTVNDALANMGRTSTEELVDRYGEIGFQWIHEYEADIAGLRILALAGYNPHAALSHFESVTDLHEIQPIDKAESSWTGSLFKLWTRATHPSTEKRTQAIRDELARWEREAEKEKKENQARANEHEHEQGEK
ncbi:hypothetical protein IAT40_006154 [Kwoniella sp. CBS 6097]